MFLAFNDGFLASVKAYCFQYPLETIEISHYLMTINSDSLSEKRAGRLYLYLEKDEIRALIFFNNKGVMYLSNHSEKLYGKVDFLKTIHKEMPKFVKGEYTEIERLFYFLQRALKKFKFYPSILMERQDSDFADVKTEQIFAAKEINWQENANFLLNVDNFFRADALSINYIRQKLQSGRDIDFYYVYADDNKVRGQIIGEYSNYRYGVLGGIFIAPEARGQGIAAKLIDFASNVYRNKHLVPLLYVAKDNQAAILLYQKLGFVKQMDVLEMEIRL